MEQYNILYTFDKLEVNRYIFPIFACYQVDKDKYAYLYLNARIGRWQNVKHKYGKD